jgi:GxxExxY protein
VGKLLYEAESFAIRGAAMKAHSELGCGFLEAVFHEALCIEFTGAGIPFQPEQPLKIRYRDRVLNKTYIADFVCYDKIIVELKCLKKITDIERAQALNYLKVTGFRLALIVNFSPLGNLEIERIVL